MKRRLLVLGVLVGLVAAPACSRGDGDDDGFRLELDGHAALVGGDPRTIAAGRHTVEVGETIRMLDGEAVLELPGDRSVLLRSAGGESTVIEVDAAPSIVEGEAVVLAGDETRFRAGDVDVVATGSARVQRGLGVTIALYDGSAEVSSSGRDFSGGLPALRQLSVPATGVLPREAVPLVYDDVDPDPWDLRFLGDAIELGDQLDDRSRGFTGQLGPGARADADLLRRVLPPLADADELDSLVATGRSPGEALIGAAIVVERATADVVAAWDDVFSFREAGARWGLVALDQQVKRDALLTRITDAFGRSPLLFAAPPRQSTATTGPTRTTSTTAPRDPGTTTPTTSPTTTEPPPIVTLPPLVTIPPLVESDDDDAGPADASPDAPPLEGTVDDILDALLDGVLGDP